MACMGPSEKDAHEEAEKAFKEVWKLLQDKYHLSDPDKIHTHYLDVKGKRRKFKKPMKFGAFNDEYSSAKQALKKALKEVFWMDACNSF